MSGDVWAAGDLYEAYIGRWSRLVAEEFIAWLSVPEGSDWVDVGCGTGALSSAVFEASAPRSVRGIDPSPAFVDHARDRVADAKASFEVGDARSLPLADGAVDVAVSGLVLNFVPEPPDALAEMARVVRPGGTAAAYVWDYAGKMELLRYFWDAACALDEAAGSLDEGRRFPAVCDPDALSNLFAGAGLSSVQVRPIDVPTRFSDFDEFWNPFLGGQGPAAGYAMSLDEDRRALLRDRLRSTLPTDEDGSIDLIARAWAAKGVVQ